jgi:hypothetical protein
MQDSRSGLMWYFHHASWSINHVSPPYHSAGEFSETSDESLMIAGRSRQKFLQLKNLTTALR